MKQIVGTNSRNSRATNQFTLSLASRPVLGRAMHATRSQYALYTTQFRSQLHSRPEQCGASRLALFYRKGLIALPITDNATINDLRERRGGKSRGRGGGYPVALPLHRFTSSPVYGLYTRNDVCNGASTL